VAEILAVDDPTTEGTAKWLAVPSLFPAVRCAKRAMWENGTTGGKRLKLYSTPGTISQEAGFVNLINAVIAGAG
jgi:hypothetical protein